MLAGSARENGSIPFKTVLLKLKEKYNE